jgi:hypothetical protein
MTNDQPRHQPNDDSPAFSVDCPFPDLHWLSRLSTTIRGPAADVDSGEPSDVLVDGGEDGPAISTRTMGRPAVAGITGRLHTQHIG